MLGRVLDQDGVRRRCREVAARFGQGDALGALAARLAELLMMSGNGATPVHEIGHE